VANTEYVVEPWPKSTRSQPTADQFCTENPAAGVAETSFTLCAATASTTTPPAVSYRASELVGEGDGDAGAGGRTEGTEGVAPGRWPPTALLAGDGIALGEGDADVVGTAVVDCAPAARTPGGVSAAGISTESTPSQATPEATAVAPTHAASASGGRLLPPSLPALSLLPLGSQSAGSEATGSLPTGHGLRCHPMANVLLVEDDADVRSAVIRQLSAFGHAVRSAGTALAALREATRDPGDIIVLDLGLPDLDGAETLKMLRAITKVPVIIATARDDEAEIIRLLNAGADDYLVKPFSGGHLAARITALLRRSGSGQAPPTLRVGGLEVDPRRREARLDGRTLDLSRREFDLLAYLAARPGEVVTRRELLTEVWQLPYGDDQTIDVHLSWLRRKLGERASAPRYLHTVRGVGVRLTGPPPQ
jgi:DNA-binding response OmpR family regulator